VLLAHSAQAATVTWTGGGDGSSWDCATNWSTGSVPGSGDEAFFNITGDLSVTLGTDQTVASLRIESHNKTHDLALNPGGAHKLFLESGNITTVGNGEYGGIHKIHCPIVLGSPEAYWLFGHKHYVAFYASITQGGDLDSIRREKRAMVDALRLSAVRLLKLQGAVTLVALLMAGHLVQWLGLIPQLVPVLRLCLLGAFGQVMLLILLIFLLYFEWRREAAALAGLFLVLNTGLTVLTFSFGPQYYGFGYLVACVAALGVGLAIFERRMEDLEFETFTRQPMHA
jgi:hypothetical protein